MKKIIVTLIMILMLAFSGCQLVQDETGTHIRLRPGIHKQIGEAGEGATGILEILSMFVPALAPAAAAAATGTYAWKRMGKKVTKYKTPLEHLVEAVEAIKGDPKLYEKVKPYLKGGDLNPTVNGGIVRKPSAKTEATVRELIDTVNGIKV